MEIKCNKKELTEALSKVSKAVANKTTLSILECILIQADKNLKLTANNTELGIESSIDADITEGGSIAVEAKLFSDIVRKLPDGEVTIKTEDSMCLIQCGRSKFNVAARESNEYPFIEDVEKDAPIVMLQYELKEIIRQTIFAIAQNENNKIMTGALFQVADDKLKVTTLDGHRIAIRAVDLNNQSKDCKVIIPGKTLIEINKILSDNGTVNLYMDKSMMLFEFGNTVVTSRLIEGDYFDVDKMKMPDYETKITADRAELIECLDRATLLVKDTDRKPTIFEINDGEMSVHINSTLGSMNEIVAIDKSGADVRIGFNPYFLIDALRVIDDGKVNIYFGTNKQPCHINDDAETYYYMILPISLNKTANG